MSDQSIGPAQAGLRRVPCKRRVLRSARQLMVLALAGLTVAAAHADELLIPPSARELPFASEVLAALGDRNDIIWEREVPVRMRDGVALSTDVIRLRSAKGKLPAVLLRTPYSKVSSLVGERHPPRHLLQAGYALVLQNERGTGWSEGSHRYLVGAREDGYDTLTWIAEQPWSNGRVGMVGCSSLGENQLPLATLDHPALRALIAESPASAIGPIPNVDSQGAFYRGGVPLLHAWLGWYLTGNSHHYRPQIPPDTPLEQRARIAEWYYPFIAQNLVPDRAAALAGRVLAATETLPSADIAKGLGFPDTEFDRLITLPPADPHWRTIDFIRDDQKVRVPALYVGTWFDIGTYELVQLYKHVSSEPHQRLIIAPTSHCRHRSASAHTYAGARYVGDARLDWEAIYIDWLDRWLKDDRTADTGPAVKLYMLGANRWIDGEGWPVRPVEPTSWFLGGIGAAKSSGGGTLAAERPRAARTDTFVSDPLRPVNFAPPSCCGSGVVSDQTAVARRSDVLVYTSEPLAEPVTIAGEVSVRLFVSADVKDTDLAVKLVDVHPDGGPAYNVADSMLRLRYRDSFEQPRLMTPGKVYEVTVGGMVAGIRFGRGHRLRLEIAGTNFPSYERNMNTGGENHAEANPVPATITVHTGPARPSRLILPVIAADRAPRERGRALSARESAH